MTQATGGRWREGNLLARVPGCAAYLLGEVGNRGREASSGEDEEASLKHLEPEREKARGRWPQGREAWAAVRDLDRGSLKGQENGPDRPGDA